MTSLIAASWFGGELPESDLADPAGKFFQAIGHGAGFLGSRGGPLGHRVVAPPTSSRDRLASVRMGAGRGGSPLAIESAPGPADASRCQGSHDWTRALNDVRESVVRSRVWWVTSEIRCMARTRSCVASTWSLVEREIPSTSRADARPPG